MFNYLTGYSRQTEYRALLVAPVSLRVRFRSLVEREMAHARAGRPAGIVIKNNSIADPGIIQLLYRASLDGVRIDGIVRGICCLRPGVPGVSDHIQIRSVVGRFLEHSRVYTFENGGNREIYIGSADLMERNLDRRVEVLCPVLDPAIGTRSASCFACICGTTPRPPRSRRTDDTRRCTSSVPDRSTRKRC